MSKKFLIIGGIVGLLLLIALVFGGSCIALYNQLVSADESVDTAWSQVENVLQRRFDLIPNLVETVKGYASHEKELFENVTKARSQVAQANQGGNINDKITAQESLGSALSRLLLVVENYPNLKANQNFIALQDELAGTENRIAVERRRFNEVVKQYNLLIRRFPTNFMAKMMGLSARRYFESDEGAEKVPQVKFN